MPPCREDPVFHYLIMDKSYNTFGRNKQNVGKLDWSWLKNISFFKYVSLHIFSKSKKEMEDKEIMSFLHELKQSKFYATDKKVKK